MVVVLFSDDIGLSSHVRPQVVEPVKSGDMFRGQGLAARRAFKILHSQPLRKDGVGGPLSIAVRHLAGSSLEVSTEEQPSSVNASSLSAPNRKHVAEHKEMAAVSNGEGRRGTEGVAGDSIAPQISGVTRHAQVMYICFAALLCST